MITCKKETGNINLIKEFNNNDHSTEKYLCDIKELDETESIHIDKKNLHKIYYNINQTKITNSQNEANFSIQKKINVIKAFLL